MLNCIDETLQNILLAVEGDVYGFTLDVIKDRYGHKSVATVARRQKKARDNNHVTTRVVLDIPEKYKDGFLKCLSYYAIEDRLLGALKARFPDCNLRQLTVAPCLPGKSESDHRAVQAGVAFHTAGWLCHDILQVYKNSGGTALVNIGLNYGRMVHEACVASYNYWSGDDLKNIPVNLSGLCGVQTIDPEENPENARTVWAVSSTVNCDALAKVFENKAPLIRRINTPPQLQLKQSTGPEANMSKQEREALKKYLMSDPGYKYLYGDRPIFPTVADVTDYLAKRNVQDKKSPQYGRFLDLDIVVTGLSGLERRAGFYTFSLPDLQSELRTIQKFPCVAGEVASHIFLEDGTVPRREGDSGIGKMSSEKDMIGMLNSLRVGLLPEDLMELAKRKSGEDGGGVIMCCSENTEKGRAENPLSKAKALFTAITKMNMVNHAIIDLEIARSFYPRLGFDYEHFEADKRKRDSLVEFLL